MFIVLFCIAIVFFIIGMIWFKHDLRIQWNSVASFFAFVIFVCLIRMGIVSFLSNGTYTPETSNIQFWQYIMVFWEDLFFSFSLFLVAKLLHKIGWNFYSKSMFYSLTIALSVIFASGHIYEGYVAASLILFYPYFVSYRCGLKYGWGTIMVCHIMYDCITVLCDKIMPIIM